MTDETKARIKTLLDQGISPRAIANELHVPIDEVLALKRGAIGRAADAVAEVARPVLAAAGISRFAAELQAAAEATRRLAVATWRSVGEFRSGAGYEPAPGGGKTRDGSPAPASLLDPRWQNRNKARRGHGL